MDKRLNEELDEIVANFNERFNAGAEPEFRGPTPPAPTNISETWAPAALVSETADENALCFRSRFYIDATGKQQYHSVKVQLNVKIRKLGLSAEEEARLVAVARPHYKKKGHELLLSCSRYLEVPRNKAHLRQTVEKLLADARANAATHAEAPDVEKPLAARAVPWIAGDPRAYRGRPKHYFRPKKKSPG